MAVPRPGFYRKLFEFLLVGGRQIEGCGDFVNVSEGAPNDRALCIAQSCRRLDQGVEHHLQVESRAANDPQYISGCGLLLVGRFLPFERLRQLAD
jgi:hypothetical protein